VGDGVLKQHQCPRARGWAATSNHRILLDDLPWVNLYIANQFEAMKTYVKGYTHIATGTNIALRNVWLDK
jgi:hypothetical protein